MRMLPLLAALFAFSPLTFAADKYADFADLAAHKTEGKDFTVTVKDRKAPVTVIAPHSGVIEPGTGQLAAAVAGDDWNIYIFEALGDRHSMEMHVTAAHFDDPRAVALSTEAVVGVSLHGEKDEGKTICIGGSNAELRKAVSDSLLKSGFTTEEPCRRLPGGGPKNIVNRARKGGVQLELSRDISLLLQDNADERSRFARAIRAAVETLLQPVQTVK